MTYRLPSLTALRSFEAAARHQSFARAAGELSVTPAAVGFQIKQLEEDLGVPLFLRKNRSVELTDKGRDLFAYLGPAFEGIQRGWDAAQGQAETSTLKVSGPAKAVHSWVLAALSAAKSTQPDVRISWDLSRQNRDVADGDVDLVIRWALEPEGDLHWVPLLRPWFTPLMRPDVARFVRRADQLEEQGLIDVEFVLDKGMGPSAWGPWFRLNGLQPPSGFAVSCSDTASAVETAIATGHVAIGGSFLSAEPLATGRLVAPFDTAIAPYSRFWLVCRRGMEQTDEYRWFLEAVRQGTELFSSRSRGIKTFHPDGRPVDD